MRKSLKSYDFIKFLSNEFDDNFGSGTVCGSMYLRMM